MAFFLFNKKKEEKMQELLTEDNIIMDGTFECADFVCLHGGTPEYLYCEEFNLNTKNEQEADELVKKLTIRSGVDEEKAQDYTEKAMFALKIYMDKRGNFEFILEFDVSDEFDCVLTEREREMLIRKTKEHFLDNFGVDLARLPELIKGCHNVEQLFDKFEVERGKGIAEAVKVYNLEQMEFSFFDKEKFNSYSERTNKILTCTFHPDKKTSAELCREAGIRENSRTECKAIFDNHMQMTLEVNNGKQSNTIKPKSSLDKEIRAGISSECEKRFDYSLAEYMDKVCPNVYFEKPSVTNMKYYCQEMQKQTFFSEEMNDDFYGKDNLFDWALDLQGNYQDYGIEPIDLHKEFDHYSYPNIDVRYALLEQMNDYKEEREEHRRFKEECEKEGISYEDEIEVPF